MTNSEIEEMLDLIDKLREYKEKVTEHEEIYALWSFGGELSRDLQGKLG